MTSPLLSFAICISVAAVIAASASTTVGAQVKDGALQVAAAPASATIAGEPGSSFDAAIVLEGATNELSGVQAESIYIAKHYPGWPQNMQALLNHDGRMYDRIDIVGPKGESKSLYFDITDWFGKLD
jgi:hypothetical protein